MTDINRDTFEFDRSTIDIEEPRMFDCGWWVVAVAAIAAIAIAGLAAVFFYRFVIPS